MSKKPGAVHEESTAIEETLRLRERRLSKKREKLTDAFLYREVIDAATYQEELAGLEQQICAVRSERHEAELEGLDIEGLLNYAEHVAMNAGTLWRDANPEQRLRLQRFWFPTGVTWSNGTVGTAVTSLPFSELATETSGDSSVATLVIGSSNRFLGGLRSERGWKLLLLLRDAA